MVPVRGASLSLAVRVSTYSSQSTKAREPAGVRVSQSASTAYSYSVLYWTRMSEVPSSASTSRRLPVATLMNGSSIWPAALWTTWTTFSLSSETMRMVPSRSSGSSLSSQVTVTVVSSPATPPSTSRWSQS